MSSLVEKLTAEGQGEPAGWLNELVAQLWPNINAAGSKMIKEIVEPMFKTMLPGPLSSLHFTKIDLGYVPLRFSNVKVTKTEIDGIKLDMNVDWESKVDVEMDADMMPALGVESVELYGRLSVLLCPLTNIIPLIGAAQVSFVNPPILKLDFTGAANVADFSAIDGAVRNAILGIINSMLTLPNRYLVKMDATSDYFKTYHYPLGIIRITVKEAWGFAEESKGTAKKLFHKITRAHPDCFAKVEVGAEEAWKTTTKDNTVKPAWNETHDFVVSDFDQCIKIVVEDQDVNSNDEVGMGVTTVRELLMAGGNQELTLLSDGAQTDGRLSIGSQFFKFENNGGSFSSSEHKGDGLFCGLATVLIASANGIKGQRDQLTPSVVVTWGSKHRFQTAVKTDAPGTDINNPSFDYCCRMPVSADMVGSKVEPFRLTLMNGEKEMGSADIALTDVLNASNGTLQNTFAVGEGASIRASICMRGMVSGTMKETELPERKKR
ncbi:uncharacterized protein LTR77_011210 [Saxophila tyrrhenica]|uniref:C2 domain-containing protein n=1 Tax=Saxophila tyrrhenica TaxID=1690608 RepID=A0AAV9NUT1_9PEZI|nr:hypothetical protein LTR77_011210 [Saxophila tyrrhenica]